MASETVTIGGVEVEIVVDPSEARKGMDKLASDGDKTAKRFQKSSELMRSATDKFAKGAAIAYAAVSAAMIKVINDVQQLANVASSLGLTVEQFTRLDHAARSASVSSEVLRGAVDALYARMSERDALSEGVNLFRGLGVEAIDSSGKIRDLDKTLLDLADKFSKMEDSAEKTQLAIRLFGGAGKELIPMLNLGRQGIKDMMDESDRLGFTVKNKTAKAFGDFGAEVEKLKSKMFSLTTQSGDKFLPEMTRVIKSLRESSTAARLFENVLGIVSFGVRETTSLIIQLSKYSEILTNTIMAQFRAVGLAMTGQFTKAGLVMRQSIADNRVSLAELADELAKLYGKTGEWQTTVSPNFVKGSAPVINTAGEIAAALAKAKEATREFVASVVDSNTATFVEKINAIKTAVSSGKVTMQELGAEAGNLTADLLAADFVPYQEKLNLLKMMLDEGIIKHRQYSSSWKAVTAEMTTAANDMVAKLLENDLTPFEEKFKKLNRLMQSGAIDVKTYGDAWVSVNKAQEQAVNDMLTSATQALTALFGENKAVAIASAIINTYQGITKALATYPPPYSYAMAASQAAMGFAQVAKIQATGKNSSGGGSGAGARAAPPPAQGGNEGGGAGPRAGQTMFVEGLDPNVLVSGDMTRMIVKNLIQYQRDGGEVVLR